MILLFASILIGLFYGLLNSVWDRDNNEMFNNKVWLIHRDKSSFIYIHLRNPF